MNVRENALVQKCALSFIEKVGNHENIWDIYEQISDLLSIIHDSQLSDILRSGNVSREDKITLIRTLQQSDFWQINDLIEYMIHTGHPDLISEALEAAKFEINKFKNEFDASIVSVYSLTETQKQRICQLVEKRFSLGIHDVKEVLDPNILGGFIVTVNHKVIDASVRRQLKNARNRL